MKLHLPKLLRNALLACISAVAGIALTMGSACAISVSEGYVQSSFSTTANKTVETATGTWTYDVASQTLTIAAEAVNVTTITFDMSLWGDKADFTGAGIVYTNAGDVSTGLYAKQGGDMGGYLGSSNGLWGSGPAAVSHELLEDLAGEDDSIKVTLTMRASGHGVLSSDVDSGETLYSANGLKASSATWTSLTVNKELVSKIYYDTTTQGQKVSNADGTWSTVYATLAQDTVSEEKVDATLFISNARNQINGGENGNGVKLSANGGDIIVGGAGHLYLQTWGAGEINLNNNLYIGSSTFSEGNYNTTNHGVIEIGNDGNSATNLYGEVYVVENSSIVSCADAGGAKAVNFHNTVTGNYALVVGGDNYHFKKEVNLATLTLTQGHWQSTHRTTGSMTFEDAVRVNELIVDSGVTVNFTNTSTLDINQMVANSGVVNLNGGALKVSDLSHENYDMVGGTFKKIAAADGEAADNGYATTLQYTLISGSVTCTGTERLEGVDSIASVDGVGLVGTASTTDTTTFYVNNGVVVLGNDGYTDASASTYIVAGGATLDTNQSLKDSENKHVILREGATLARSGNDVGTGSIMLTKLTLEGDATVDLAKNYGLLGKGHNPTTLTLNGNTLDKQGEGIMYLVNTAVDSGTIKISDGSVEVRRNAQAGADYTANYRNTAFVLDGGNLSFVCGALQVGSINGTGNVSGTGTLAFFGNNVSVIDGVVTTGGLTVAGGTVEVTNTLNLSGALNFGQNTAVKFTGTDKVSTVGSIGMNGNGAGGQLVIGATNVLNAGSVNFSWNRNLLIDGVLNVTGDDGFRAGVGSNTTMSIRGSGTLNTKKLTVANYCTLKVDGVTLILGEGGLDVTAQTTLAISDTVTSAGNVTLAGTVDLYGGTGALITTGSGSYSAENNNGFYTGDLYVIKTEGESTMTLGDGFALKLAGAAVDSSSYKVEDNNLIVKSSGTGTYYINNGSIAATNAVVTTTGFTDYYVAAGQTLTITTGDSLSEDNARAALLSANGPGTVSLASNLTLNNQMATVGKGTLSVGEGVTLTLGGGDGNTVSISSFSSIVIDGGQITFNNKRDTFNNLTVTSKGGAFHSEDHGNDPNNQPGTVKSTFAGTTQLDGDFNFTARYNGQYAFEKLAGTGNFTVTQGSETLSISLGDLSEYKGEITASGVSIDLNGNSVGSTGTLIIKDNASLSLNSNVGIKLDLRGMSATVKGTEVSFKNDVILTNTNLAGLELLGSACSTVNFEGAVSGDGNFIVAVTPESTTTFSGDVSGWNAGNIRMSNSGTIVFTGAATNIVAGLIRADANGNLKLKFDNTAAVTVDSQLGNGQGTMSLELTAGTHVTGSASASVQVDSLILGASSSLILTEQTLTFAAGKSLVVNGAGTLGSALVLQDCDLTLGGALNLNSNALTLDADHKGSLTMLDGMVTEESTIVNLITGISTLNGVTLTKDSVLGDLFLIDDEELANAAIRLNEGNLQLVFGGLIPDNVLYVSADGLSYDAAEVVEGMDTILLAGGRLTMGNTAVAAELTTLEVQGSGSIIGTGSVSEVSFDQAKVGGVLSLEDGATDLTVKFDNLTISDGGSISVAAGQILDLKSIDYKGESEAFADMLNATSGAGTVLAQATGAVVLKKNATVNTNVVMSELELNSWQPVNSVLTVSNQGSLTIENQLIVESTAKIVVAGGELEAGSIRLGHSNGGEHAGHLAMSAGSIKADSITKTASTGSTIQISGGTLELTGTDGIAAGINTVITGGTLVAKEASWDITGATIGGATVTTEGDYAITLTDTTLTSTLNNAAGKLVLTGTVDITSTGYQTTSSPREYDNNGNGYAKNNTVYDVVTTVGNLTIADGTTWTVDGSSDNVTYADGVVTVVGSDWGTEYYVRTVDATLSGIAKANAQNEALTTIVLAGKDLNMNEALGNVRIRVEKEGESIVAVGGGLTLAASQVTGTDATHQLKLHGSGTYALDSGTATLGDGTVLGDWTGTVKVTNATGVTYFNVDTLAAFTEEGVAKSTVELTGVTGHLTATPVTYKANLKLTDDGETKALTLTNGWAANVTTFAGTVSGEGSFVMASGVPSGMSIKFTGNLSGWNGAFVGNNTDKSVNLNIASTGNVGADIISQQGTLNVTFSGASTTMKGDVGYEDGVLNMTVAAGASVVMEGVLADNVALTSNGSLSLTQDTVSLASLGGTGSVSAKAMTLTGATYSMGDLKLTGALTLSESVTSLTTGKLNIAGGVNISSIASNLFSVSTIENGLTLNITEELLDETLGTMENKRVALLTLTGEFADTSVLQAVKDSVLLGAFDANGTAGQKQEGAMYDYELVWNGNTMELVASIAASACTWVGGTDYSWDTAANWSSAVGGVPTADTAVFIKGDTLTARTNIALEKTVNGEVVGVDAEVKSLTIEAWGVRQPVNIGGMGSLSIGGNLTLQSGELALLADTFIGGNIIINNQSILKLAGMDPESAPTISVDGKLVNNFQMYVDGAEVTIEGDAANKGSLVVMGGSLEINGTTTNEGTIAVAGGSLSTGDVANTGNIIIDAGSMEVEGALSHSGENSSIVVNSGSSLKVTGDLNAANMTLDFDGNVTVGGTATVGTLTNDGTFTAASATIGTLTNNGTLSVDENGRLTITTLAGTGNLTVGVGGELKIKDDATFTGTVNNKGTVKTENTMTLSNKTGKGGTIEAADLVVQSAANGSEFTSVTTDSITIESLASNGNANLTTGALSGATDKSAVSLVVNQLTTEEGMNEIIDAGERDYTLLSIGGAAPEITMAELEHEREQQLWQSGLKLTMSGVSTMDLRARETKVGFSVLQQTEKEGTWNVGDATTGIGLEVVDSAGKLMNNNVLDNVQKVVVSGSKSIDMTGDISTAKLNKLTGTSSSKLTIAGDGMTKDTVTISKSSTYMGTLVLDGVTADLDLTGATVAGADGDTALSGKLTEGTLSVKQASTAQGKGLELIGSTVEVDITKDSMSLGTDALNKLESALVDLGDVSLDADTTVELGTYDTKTGEFIKSVGYSKYFDMDNLRVEGGKVLADRNTTYYTSKLADSTSTDNGKIGLAMADEALLSANPQGATSTGDLAAVLDQLDAMVVTGNKAAADELGASLAGASTAVLGMAAMGDVDRQLRAIRNRTTTMGVDQSVVNADMPYFNAWINAEGDSREMGEDETLGGYKLNSYGGTVGFDVDIEPTLTAGMALTAMYGDLDATGADKATGNLDSYYVSAFARYCGSAWTHTFVGTIGKGDISLDRTVGGAQVKGETDSMSFGLMYEVGRVYAMDEDGTTCLQPVFNVTWKHTTVDAYTEKGGDVALNVDEQSLNTITFGLGARLQTVVGESMYNRTSIFECRLLAKAEAGDTEGTSKVALGSSASHEVKSNEMGAIGIEVGAGLTIPLGDEGSSIFMDASAEIRADYTDVNGTVGYRVNF